MRLRLKPPLRSRLRCTTWAGYFSQRAKSTSLRKREARERNRL